MRTLLPLCLLIAISPLCLAEDNSAALPAEPAGMKLIFNGKDLSDWDGDKRLWSVKDGVIHGETTSDAVAAGNTFLIWTGGQTGDFDLRLSFRCNATNNSGIQYRSSRVTEGVKNDWVLKGYQHELRNEKGFPNVSGFIYDERGTRKRICLVGEKAAWEPKTGKQVVATLIDEASFQKLFKIDDWNEVAIIAKGNRIQHYMNGQLILDFTDNDPKLALSSGNLGLQLHAGKPMWCEFKDVRIAELK
ncbi:MAG TPA: DUF1080 domain-containing protein [Planctomycetaceae bacterium]|nr:DUF1080 domain-containing protein [Planctomycetaceae bacterium]